MIPTPPSSFLALLGPGLVLIAMGLGSGEFVLWPYFVSKFGFGVLWGAVVGITLQYFVSNETGRYTLASGNSVFVGFQKLSKYFPYWFIVSTYLSFAWPGIIGSGGEILGKLLGVTEHKWLSIVMLLIIGLMFTFGGQVYANLERVQKLFMLIAIPSLVFIFLLVVDLETMLNLGKGLLGIGEGYLLLPAGLAAGQFLGAVAYSGAGGNLILSHSFYVQDKGLGMAQGSSSQIEVGKHSQNIERAMPNPTAQNILNFKRWFRLVALEQLFTFGLIGIVAIILLAVIAYGLVYPFAGGSDLKFIYAEADKLATLFPLGGSYLLLLGVTFLFTTQLGVFESTSRIMGENLQLTSEYFAQMSRSRVFFIFLWLQIAFAIGVSFLQVAAPLQILFINTFFSAVSMFVLSAAILWLNCSAVLPQEFQPGWPRRLIMALSVLFFGGFSAVAVLTA